MRSVTILNELVDHFEKLEDKRNFKESLSNFTHKVRSAWKDIMMDTELALEDAVDLGFSHQSLDVVFKSLALLESRYASQAAQPASEVDYPTRRAFRKLLRAGR
ncbi:MAG: hypothetical protein QXI90_01095 [Thermofilum sp.]